MPKLSSVLNTFDIFEKHLICSVRGGKDTNEGYYCRTLSYKMSDFL